METSKQVIKEENYFLSDENGNILSKNGYERLLHREDGPAVIFRDHNDKVTYCGYYRYNLRHRTDGPAITLYDKDEGAITSLYYLFGVPYTKEDFETPGFVDAIIMENS